MRPYLTTAFNNVLWNTCTIKRKVIHVLCDIARCIMIFLEKTLAIYLFVYNLGCFRYYHTCFTKLEFISLDMLRWWWLTMIYMTISFICLYYKKCAQIWWAYLDYMDCNNIILLDSTVINCLFIKHLKYYIALPGYII